MAIKRYRTLIGTVVLCLAAALVLVPRTDAAVLDQVPAQADAVFLVPRLSGLSMKIAGLRQTLDLPVPDMDDVLGHFKRQSGMVDGLDDDGAMLLVVPDLLPALNGGVRADFFLIVPVSDYGRFVANFGGTDQGPVTSLRMPGGESGFAKSIAGYAVLGRNKAAVESYVPGKLGSSIARSVGNVGQEYLDQCDALLYLNLERVAPALIREIDKEMSSQISQMGQGPQMGSPAFGDNLAAVEAMLRAYVDGAKAVLEGSEGVLLGLDLNDEGIGLTTVFGYKADSAMAELISPGPGRSAATLAKLPEQPFIFAGSWDAEAFAMVPLMNKLFAAIPGGENNPSISVMKQIMPLMRQVKAVSMAFYVPDQTALMSGGLMNMVYIMAVEDGAKAKASLRAYIEGLSGFSMPASGMPSPAGTQPTLGYTTRYTANALQVQGVQVDQYEIQTNLPPELFQQMGPMGGFLSSFTRYSGFIAVKGNTVLTTFIPDAQLVTKGLTAIDERGGLGAGGPISRMRATALPPNPALEAYISFGGIAEAANLFLPMMQQPLINVPEGLPPVSVGMGVNGESVATRLYVPTRTVKFVVDTVMDFQASMGGVSGPAARGGVRPGQRGPMPPPF